MLKTRLADLLALIVVFAVATFKSDLPFWLSFAAGSAITWLWTRAVWDREVMK